MPLYKQLPRVRKKTADLPLYRPIDRIFIALWTKRKKLVPVLIGLVSVAVLAGGLWAVTTLGNRRAWKLYDRNKLADVVAEYPRTPAARVARLELGRRAVEEKRYEDAIEIYEPLQGASGAFFRISALHNLALAYREKGEWLRAIELLRQAEIDSANPAPDYSRTLKEETQKKWEEISEKTSKEPQPSP